MTTDQHVVLMTVVRRGFPFQDVEVFRGSWDAAQEIWLVLDGARLAGDIKQPAGPELRGFCVRSADDPRVRKAVRGDRLHGLVPGSGSLLSVVEQIVRNAGRNFHRKALGEIAREAVADESLVTLAQVEKRVRAEVERRGITATRYEVEDAVFSRVTIGRVSTGHRYADRGRAYFLRKKDGPLHKVRVNGAGMNQTTRLYQGTFTRLVKQDDGSFAAADSLVSA